MKPHDGVCARIQKSKTNGVGVVAITNIKKGRYLFPDDELEIVWQDKTDFKKLPAAIKHLYNDFCIIKNKGQSYGCPKNFNQITISWFLNHSKTPNVEIDKEFRFFAKRNIKKGEELTVDYLTFNEWGATRPHYLN